jgi:hypothetical protein
MPGVLLRTRASRPHSRVRATPEDISQNRFVLAGFQFSRDVGRRNAQHLASLPGFTMALAL